MGRKKPPPPPPVQPLRLVGAARVIFLAGPFVLVTLMPFHELLGAACKYLGAWDEAVLRAITKTEMLPRDTDGRVPSPLVISFRPKD